MRRTEEKEIGAVVFDFDNTITNDDVCDCIMDRYAPNWKEIGKLHHIGDISHAELNRRFASDLKATPSEIREYLSTRKFLRSGFCDLLEDLQKNNVPVFIVSGGWDFYISHILENEVKDKNILFLESVESAYHDKISVICNQVSYSNGVWQVKRPIHKTFLSSPDKVRILQKLREIVSGAIIYFGDGSTDIEVSQHADYIFARDKLEEFCKRNGYSHCSFDSFININFEKLLAIFAQSKYSTTLDFLRTNFFYDPGGSNLKNLNHIMASSFERVIAVHGNGPTFQAFHPRKSPNEVIEEAELPQQITCNTNHFLQAALPLGLQHGVKAGHPLMVKNIIPTPSSVFITSHAIASMYGQNGVTGEDSGEALNSELRITAVISDMAGYDRKKSAGVFTFGGTATNMYGIKIGLLKCDPTSNISGINKKVCVIGSRPAHYSHITATDWLGIGRDNYLYARSHIDQTTDLNDLEIKCRQALDKGQPIACIIGVAGTTSNMAIDDFGEIKKIRDKLVNEYKLDYIPHIHADSVVGWPYLYFRDYDYERNPLCFPEEVLIKIQTASERISTIEHSDSFGVDFHKTGFMPYNSSIFICKDEEDLKSLGRDAKLMTPLFHDQAVYNPGKVTLETSRSSATMLATWLTMQALGKNGYQVLLAHAQEMALHVRSEIQKIKNIGLYVVNNSGYGTDIFVRCYHPHIIPEEAFCRELQDSEFLKRNSEYTSKFFQWLTDTVNPISQQIAISKTSAAFYTPIGEPYVALRLYILSPYTTKTSAQQLVQILSEAKNTFDEAMEYNTTSPYSTTDYSLKISEKL